MTLRERLVEVGAQIAKDTGHREPFASAYASEYLDAFLDTLAENADEWDRQAGIAAMSHIDRLIAVLRRDTDASG